MKLDITYDNKFLVCTSEYPLEMDLLKKFLTREIDNAWLVKKQNSAINTERVFINNYGMVPIGLWNEIVRFVKDNNIYYELTPAVIQYLGSFQLDWDKFKSWCDMTFAGAEAIDKKGNKVPFQPREYQVIAAYNLIKFKKCCGEISTAAGKTLISFIVFKWLIEHIGTKKMLYIVPNAELVSQSAEKYELYESFLKVHNKEWKIGKLMSGLTKKQKALIESCNILFGTYQSLNKRPFTFFNDFTACIQDECHHGSADSLITIINKCTALEYSIGITGTFPKSTSINNLIIQSSLGPVIYRLTADELINREKSATPIYVVFQKLNWATDEEKSALFFQRAQKGTEEGQKDLTLGTKLLKQEQYFINQSYIRLKYIGNMAIKMAKNTLILFGDIKGGYGEKLAEYIKENSDKNVYYVDGSTKPEVREEFNKLCEADKSGKTIIVASIGTYKEGVDIANIWSIFLVNSAKSENTVRQICGRGLRTLPGKDKTVLYDFVDDLRYSFSPDKKYYENYMWKHYLTRKQIYEEQKFPTYQQIITF